MEQVYIVDCARYNPQTIEIGIRVAAEQLGITLPQVKVIRSTIRIDRDV